MTLGVCQPTGTEESNVDRDRRFNGVRAASIMPAGSKGPPELAYWMPSEDQPLSALTRHKLKLMVYCSNCKRSASIDPTPIVEKYGHSYPILRLTHHLTCKVWEEKRLRVLVSGV